jgi:glycosyltransferase involved in cell wall biosynthesis
MSDRAAMPNRESCAKVVIVAPVPPPYGGMALQATLLARLLAEEGIAVEVLGHNHPFPRRFRLLESIPGLRTLVRTLVFAGRIWRRASANCVIHVFACSWLYFFLIVSPAVLVGRLKGTRVLLNYRGGDADQFLKRFRYLAEPIFRAADLITVPSRFLAGVIEQRLEMSVTLVPNIVDLSLFSFRARTEFQPKMLVTRHLEDLYGVDTVLQAFRIIQERYPNASLTVAGSGRQEAHLRGLVSEWRLRNVEFLGYVGTKDLPRLYDECDILLNGSRVDNFPASLIEAAAAGLVVISTKAGGIPSIFECDKNALLVGIDDSKALAFAVDRVLQNQDLGITLAKAALQLAQRCDWSNVRGALLTSYGFIAPTYHLPISAAQTARSET